MGTRIPPCPEGNLYTIRTGDTFNSIARRFGITVDDLIRANPGVNPRHLYAGQVICVPLAAVPPRCPAGSTTYTIKSGDTFVGIARRYKVTVQSLVAANPGIKPEALCPGQQICVPQASPAEICRQGVMNYTVRAGDTFFSLAQRFNTTVAAIQAANPKVDPNNLRPGQIICIPRSAPESCPPDRRSDCSSDCPRDCPTECPSEGTNYTVRAGDTFFSLAQRFNTTVAAIQAANPRVDPNNLRPGQIIRIPG